MIGRVLLCGMALISGCVAVSKHTYAQAPTVSASDADRASDRSVAGQAAGLRRGVAAVLPANAGVPAASAAERAESQKANAVTVGFLSGALGSTTLRFASDLSSVLDEPDKLRVLPMIGSGGYQSAQDLLYLHDVDVAILPSDLFAYYHREHLNPGAEQQINFIAKLYDEELHILARADIKNVADLAHQQVGADDVGTASSITAQTLFTALKIPADLRNESSAASLYKLQHGDIAAMVILAGKPLPIFAGLAAAAPGSPVLHFLPVPPAAPGLDAYLPAHLDHASYPNLVPESASIDTIAVGAVLAAYNWPIGSERERKVRTFVEALFAKFNQLLAPPNHPRWSDVNLAATVPGWKRLPAAEDALSKNLSLTFKAK